MQEGLSSLNPYNWSFNSETQNYSFVTDQSISYILYFTESNYFEAYPEISDKILCFGFKPTSVGSSWDKTKKVNDPRIRDTIFSFISGVLEQSNEFALFTIADHDNRSSKSRSRLFKRWYRELENQGQICFCQHSQELCDNTLCLSLLVHKECSNFSLMQECFYDLRNELISKGYPV